jgi:putative solute:sodium symporter small subunit
LPDRSRARIWRLNIGLMAILLTLWAGVTFIPAYFADHWTFSFLGWPFAFWMGAYGAPLIYLAIIVVYAIVMDRIDRSAAKRGREPG